MPLKAADVMSPNVITAKPEESVALIAKRLVDHGLSALPVCDADRHVIGIVSEGDLMWPLRQSALRTREHWLELLAEGDSLSNEFISYLKRGNRHVRDLMTAKVITVGEETSLPEIAELMVSHKIKQIPVVRDGIPVGVISRADILRVIAREGDIEV